MRLLVDGVIYEKQASGGVSRIYSETLPRLCALSPKLQIILLADTRALRQPLPQHPQIVARPVPAVDAWLQPGFLWQSSRRRIRRWARAHAAGTGEGTIWHSTYYSDSAAWRGARVVMVYDLIHERYAAEFCRPRDEKFRLLKRASVNSADLVLCNSEATRADLQEYLQCPSERIRVVPLAASSVFRPLGAAESPRSAAAEPYFLYVGTRRLYKNFDWMISSYARWPHRSSFRLVCVGGAEWTDDERRMFEQLRLADRVEQLTGVDDQQLRRLYCGATAFIYPSLYEGFGIPLLEAMACRCPVIASRIPSTTEVAGDCPFYFDPQQTDSFLAALDQSVAESPAIERLHRGQIRVANYSWDTTARQCLAVYQELAP